MMISAYVLMLTLIAFIYYTRVAYLVFVFMAVILFQGVCIFEIISQVRTERLVIFHQYKESLLLYSAQYGSQSWGEASDQTDRNLLSYSEATGIPFIGHSEKLTSAYHFNEELLFVVDRRSVFEDVDAKG